MESLSLGDNYLHRNGPITLRTYQSGYRPPCLPTPEPSRCSFEADESKPSSEVMQQEPIQNAAWEVSKDEQSLQVNGLRATPPSRLASRTQTAPQSPPYGALDEQRPSLPPLKTVLGENLSSPPRTPRIRSANSQPLPREPAYTTDTFKPPSLYPNKKQKRETLEPARPFDTVSFVSPPLSAFESPIGTRMPVNLNFTTSNTQHKPSLARRHSSNQSDTMYKSRSPTRSVHDIRTHHDARSMNPSLPRQSSHYGIPERMPLPPMLNRSTIRDEFDSRPNSSDFQKSSGDGFDRYRSLPTEDQHRRSAARYPSPTTEDFRRRDAARYWDRVEHEPFPAGPEYAPGSIHQSRHPDGSTSASYEYYYTKARKRSNLPKHSTEIMRAWFDQNMTNPYPSEDQKALFANATGISLTQVSNWFINHRRRCPELRDKRSERRKP